MPNIENTRRKILGQHMLIDDKIIDKIIKICNVNKEDNICEMGSGTGRLTIRLAEFGNQVESFEIDKNLYRIAKRLESKFSNLKVINDDLLNNKFKKIDFDVFISNIPYSKSRKILLWLSTKKFRYAIIMVQKEFADKLKKPKGSPNYRAISAICQYRFDIEELFSVDKNSFFPVPKVESKVIKLSPKSKTDRDNQKILTEEEIKRINLFFSAKNRLVSYLIKKYDIRCDNEIIKVYTDNKVRFKDLEPEEIIKLARG